MLNKLSCNTVVLLSVFAPVQEPSSVQHQAVKGARGGWLYRSQAQDQGVVFSSSLGGEATALCEWVTGMTLSGGAGLSYATPLREGVRLRIGVGCPSTPPLRSVPR